MLAKASLHISKAADYANAARILIEKIKSV
jgi:hypothetical protein